MPDLATDLLAAGGAATRTTLRALGHSHASLRTAVAQGVARAVTRSWLALPDTDFAITDALTAGGVVGGASALQTYGVWVTQAPPPQIATRPHANLATPDRGERIWGTFELDERPWRVCIVDALAQHCSRVARADAVASIDSALHQGLISAEQLDELFARLPVRCRGMRKLLDAAAGSGLESLLRVPLRERGWGVESQAPVPGGGFCDLLVNGWLYVEADGAEWHDNPDQAKTDRRRNAAIDRASGRWLRFGYADIVHDLPQTLDLIALVLAQGKPAARKAVATTNRAS